LTSEVVLGDGIALGWQAWFSLGVVAAMVVGLVIEFIAADVVVFSALAMLIVAGILTPEEAAIGFANPATLTIGGLFVVAAAFRETGAVSGAAHYIFGRATSMLGSMVRLVVPTAFFSAFLNNTPIVAIFAPVVHDWLRRSGESPSRYLIPLSYAAILGGTCTLIGTSTNLVVGGLLLEHGYPGLGMFEISRVGVPVAIVGCLALVLIAPRTLPDRRDLIDQLSDERREYIVEMAVEPDSPLIGKSIEEAELRHLPGLFLIEIERRGKAIAPVAPGETIDPRDRLIFTGVAASVVDLQKIKGLVPATDTHYRVDEEGEGERRLYEVVVSPTSPLVGVSIRDAGFRGRYDAAVIAVHRHGARLVGKLGDVVLRAGDTLMLEGTSAFGRNWRNSLHFYLVSELHGTERPRFAKARLAILILAAMIALAALEILPLVTAVFAAAGVLLLTRCISPSAARRSLDFSVLILIAAAFGVARALEKTGAAEAVAMLLVRSFAAHGPVAALAGVYLITSLFTAFITNNAAAVICFPVALSVAAQLGVDPRPFAIAIALAASTSFATPMSYQTNLIVYGPGGYRFMDFVKAGLPLTLLVFLVAMLVIPVAWPF
jgi:di/tricarboxylate transporter